MSSISYAFKDDPLGTRFVQDDADPLPAWAVDVLPFVQASPTVTPVEAFAEVFCRNWTQQQFLSWFDQQQQEVKYAATKA